MICLFAGVNNFYCNNNNFLAHVWYTSHAAQWSNVITLEIVAFLLKAYFHLEIWTDLKCWFVAVILNLASKNSFSEHLAISFRSTPFALFSWSIDSMWKWVTSQTTTLFFVREGWESFSVISSRVLYSNYSLNQILTVNPTHPIGNSGFEQVFIGEDW